MNNLISSKKERSGPSPISSPPPMEGNLSYKQLITTLTRTYSLP